MKNLFRIQIMQDLINACMVINRGGATSAGQVMSNYINSKSLFLASEFSKKYCRFVTNSEAKKEKDDDLECT